MLKFRGQYESLRDSIMGDSSDSERTIIETADAARVLLWSAWNCMGHDGKRVEPDWGEVYSLDGHGSTDVDRGQYENWPQEWTYECDRCCSALPGALRAWQKLQHPELKKLVQ